jgi:hypothetical protein
MSELKRLLIQDETGFHYVWVKDGDTIRVDGGLLFVYTTALTGSISVALTTAGAPHA